MAENNTPMTGQDCLDTIAQLARSQGSYGRMNEQINQMDNDTREELMNTLEAQQFNDPVDLVIWLES